MCQSHTGAWGCTLGSSDAHLLLPGEPERCAMQECECCGVHLVLAVQRCTCHMCVSAQEYMVQWVAKLASAERDYRETLAAVARAPVKPPKTPTAKPSTVPTGRGFRAAAGARRGAPAAGLGLGLGPANREAADAAAAAAVAALEPDETDAWYLDALDLIMAHVADRGDRAAEAIRDHLRARDQCAPGGPC